MVMITDEKSIVLGHRAFNKYYKQKLKPGTPPTLNPKPWTLTYLGAEQRSEARIWLRVQVMRSSCATNPPPLLNKLGTCKSLASLTVFTPQSCRVTALSTRTTSRSSSLAHPRL